MKIPHYTPKFLSPDLSYHQILQSILITHRIEIMSQPPPPPPRVPVVEESDELNGKMLSADVEEVAAWKKSASNVNDSTSEAPRPFRFRIHATVNSSKDQPTISDTTFVVSNPSSSFCNLSNETLRVVIPRSTITNPDCTINLSGIEEETGDIFMSINLNVGGGNLTKLKLSHKNVHITSESSNSKKRKDVNIKGHLHYGDDEGTKQMKTMEQRSVPPRWRTGYLSLKCKGENLPLNHTSTSITNVTPLTTAAVSPCTENSIFLFSCKHLIRTQHHATSSRESGAIQLKLAKTREAKDRKNLCFVFFICFLFLLVGIIFFPLMEEWTVLDALYFGVVTLTTVGYGDLLPTSDGSKVFTTLYVFFGVSIVATTIGLFQAYLIEAAALRADLKKRQQRKQMLENESDSDSDEEEEKEEEEEEEEDQHNENSPEEQNVEEKHKEKNSARHHLARHSSLSPLAIQSHSTSKSKSAGSNNCCATINFFALQFLPPVLIGILGILVMMYGQNERFVDALYWSVVTGTTVG